MPERKAAITSMNESFRSHRNEILSEMTHQMKNYCISFGNLLRNSVSHSINAKNIPEQKTLWEKHRQMLITRLSGQILFFAFATCAELTTPGII